MTMDKLQEAIRLLKDLSDLQNGPPLETHRKEWEQTMEEVYSFLSDNKNPWPVGTKLRIIKKFDLGWFFELNEIVTVIKYDENDCVNLSWLCQNEEGDIGWITSEDAELCTE